MIVRLFLFLLFPLTIYGQSFHEVALNGEGHVEVKGRLFYHHELSDEESFDQIRNTEFTALEPATVPSFGFAKGTHWFRVDINNPSVQEEWFLEISYAPLDHIEVYSKENGEWTKQVSGDHFPVSHRQIKHRHFVFPLQVNAGSNEVFIKVRSTSSINLPIAFWRPSQFYQWQVNQQFGHGVFYGILLIMIFYNLFLYLSIRDINTLYYIFTLLAGANVIAFFQGYGFYLLYPEVPELNTLFTMISGPLFIITSGLLARSFLNLKHFNFWLDRTLVAISIVTLLVALNLTAFSEILSFKSLHILTVLNSLLILVSAIYCFYRRYRPARFFLLAWISALVAAALFSLRNLGVIHSNWLTESSLYFGGIMQTLLISLALGDRINILTKENTKVKEAQLKHEIETNDRLERQVNERTEEIRLKNEELEEINAVKDKLFSMISHDLKGPLNSLRGTLSVLRFSSFSPEELKKITDTISTQLQDTSVLLDHLLQWGKTQMLGMSFDPKTLRINDVIESVEVLLRHEFAEKKILLKDNLEENWEVMADETMLSTVLRNLLSNALKFTANGEVSVATHLYQDMVIISVTDSGTGIPVNYRDNLFTLAGVTTLGTREEKGTGIGLVLCKEFVERNGGSIWVESEEGVGSSFSFSVPLKK